MLTAASCGRQARRLNLEDRTQLKQIGEKRSVAQNLRIELQREFGWFPRTNTPEPWRGSTAPSNLNRAIASRTTLRLTPKVSANSRSVGQPVADPESAREDLVGNHPRDL